MSEHNLTATWTELQEQVKTLKQDKDELVTDINRLKMSNHAADSLVGGLKENIDGYKHRTTAHLKLIEELEAQVKYWEDKEVDRAVCCSFMQDALELIAAPKRPDGTYNRSREACEQLARETLARLEEK